MLTRPGCPLSLQGLGLRVWLASRPICLGFEAGSLTEHKHLADLTEPLGSSSLRNPRFWNDKSILVRSWCGCCDLESCVFAWQWLSPPSPPTTPQIISFTSVPTADRTRPGVIDLYHPSTQEPKAGGLLDFPKAPWHPAPLRATSRITVCSPPTRSPRGRYSRFSVFPITEHAQLLTTTNSKPRPAQAAPSFRLPIGCRGLASSAQAHPANKRRQWAWPRAGKPDSASRVHWSAA